MIFSMELIGVSQLSDGDFPQIGEAMTAVSWKSSFFNPSVKMAGTL